MLDKYWFGDVERISPEAPVPVVKMGRMEDRPGAAANVAANCVAMGVECNTLYSGSLEPVVKIRVIARQQQVARVDFDEPQDPIDEGKFGELVQDSGIVVFSDYGKGSLANIRALISIAKSFGKIVLVDPKGHDYHRYSLADLIKPNIHEMREMIGGWGTEAHLERKASQLMRETDIRAILLTRASDGMTLFTADRTSHIPCVAKEVFDVSGAGDTAIAAVAVALTRGNTLEEAARYANKAAGIVVGRFGTAVATEAEVFG